MKKKLEQTAMEMCYWHRVALSEYIKLQNGELTNPKLNNEKQWKQCYNCNYAQYEECQSYLANTTLIKKQGWINRT